MSERRTTGGGTERRRTGGTEDVLRDLVDRLTGAKPDYSEQMRNIQTTLEQIKTNLNNFLNVLRQTTASKTVKEKVIEKEKTVKESNEVLEKLSEIRDKLSETDIETLFKYMVAMGIRPEDVAKIIEMLKEETIDIGALKKLLERNNVRLGVFATRISNLVKEQAERQYEGFKEFYWYVKGIESAVSSTSDILPQIYKGVEGVNKGFNVFGAVMMGSTLQYLAPMYTGLISIGAKVGVVGAHILQLFPPLNYMMFGIGTLIGIVTRIAVWKRSLKELNNSIKNTTVAVSRSFGIYVARFVNWFRRNYEIFTTVKNHSKKTAVILTILKGIIVGGFTLLSTPVRAILGYLRLINRGIREGYKTSMFLERSKGKVKIIEEREGEASTLGKIMNKIHKITAKQTTTTGKIMAVVKAILGWLVISKTSDWLKKIFDLIKPVLGVLAGGGIFAGIAKAGSAIVSALKVLVSAGGGLGALVIAILAALGAVGALDEALGITSKKMLEHAKADEERAKQLEKQGKHIVAWGYSVVSTFEKVSATVAGFGETLPPVLREIVIGVADFITGIGAIIVVLSMSAEGWADLFNTLGKKIQEAWETAIENLKTYSATIVSLGARISATITSAIGSVKGNLEVFAGFITNITTALSSALTGLQNILTAVVGGLDAMVNNIKSIGNWFNLGSFKSIAIGTGVTKPLINQTVRVNVHLRQERDNIYVSEVNSETEAETYL